MKFHAAERGKITVSTVIRPQGKNFFARATARKRPSGRRPTLTYLTSITLTNANKADFRPRGRHLFARGLLPFQHRRHVFLRRLLLIFSTCACKSPHNGLIYTKKGGTRPPLLFSVPQRYNIFRRKARSVKTGRGYGTRGPQKHPAGTGKAAREGGFAFFFPHAEHFFGISAYLCRIDKKNQSRINVCKRATAL